MTKPADINFLLRCITEGYDKRAWHGANLRGSIRGLSPEETAWRPGKNRHNILEIVVHCAYWKYAVRRRIAGEKRGSFPIKGSNWFVMPVGSVIADWRYSKDLLETTHLSLIECISGLKKENLIKIPKGSRVDNLTTIAGIAMHDVYHAGQIQLIKKIMISQSLQ